MTKDPLIHFPFYINQYQGLLAKYSFEEKGAFISLLCVFLSEDGKMPEEEQQLFRMCLAFLDTEKKAIENIKDETCRIGREILKVQKDKRKKCRDSAKLGGLQRIANAQANAQETLKRKSSNTETDTDTYKETETNTDKERDISAFNNFWENYIPVKTSDGTFTGKGDKKPTKAKYLTIIKSNQELIEEINLGLQNYLRDCSKNNRYTKQAIGFLKNETWKEYQTTEQITIIAEGNHGNNTNGSKSIREQTAELMREIEDAEFTASQQL